MSCLSFCAISLWCQKNQQNYRFIISWFNHHNAYQNNKTIILVIHIIKLYSPVTKCFKSSISLYSKYLCLSYYKIRVLLTQKILYLLLNHISLHYANNWLWLIQGVWFWGQLIMSAWSTVIETVILCTILEIRNQSFLPLTLSFFIPLYVHKSQLFFSFHSTGKNPYKKPDGVKVGYCISSHVKSL